MTVRAINNRYIEQLMMHWFCIGYSLVVSTMLRHIRDIQYVYFPWYLWYQIFTQIVDLQSIKIVATDVFERRLVVPSAVA